MSRLLLAISLIVPTMLAGQRADPSANEAALALAIDREVLRVASSQSLWPGYQPASVRGLHRWPDIPVSSPFAASRVHHAGRRGVGAWSAPGRHLEQQR